VVKKGGRKISGTDGNETTSFDACISVSLLPLCSLMHGEREIGAEGEEI